MLFDVIHLPAGNGTKNIQQHNACNREQHHTTKHSQHNALLILLVWIIGLALGSTTLLDAQISNPGGGGAVNNPGGGSGSGGIAGNVTAGQGVAGIAANTLGPVPEEQYLTVGGNTSIACKEDQNAGVWDVRCLRGGVSWSTNPTIALVNTMIAAKCYQVASGNSGQTPRVLLPSGGYTIGGNIQVPPNIVIQGQTGDQYGQLTALGTSDPTQPMFTTVGTISYSCPSGLQTFSGNGATMANMSLIGGGSANANDIGIQNASGGSYITHISFSNFGGPGRVNNGADINSRGDYIYFQHNLQWYYFSGQYNTSGFTDTGLHCSLLLGDIDGHWDHVEGYGENVDSGYYNRYNLGNVCLGGGQGTWLTHSFLQVAPHNLIMLPGSDGSENVTINRMDNSWWESILVGEASNGNYTNNAINGWCTSSTLNPANFPSNPGGISTDPNCAALALQSGAQASYVGHNMYSEDVTSWPTFTVYVSPNYINESPATIDEPQLAFGQIGGGIGGDPADGNYNADVSRSLVNITKAVNTNTSGTLHFSNYSRVDLQDTSATTYSTFDGVYNDTIVMINIGSHDMIANSSTILTASGANIVGPAPPTFWWNHNGVLEQFGGSSGSGGSFTPGGDLSGNSTAQQVIGINGQNLAALGAGALGQGNTGVPYILPTLSLPTCSAGSVLTYNGTAFSCTTGGGVPTGDGPYVQTSSGLSPVQLPCSDSGGGLTSTNCPYYLPPGGNLQALIETIRATGQSNTVYLGSGVYNPPNVTTLNVNGATISGSTIVVNVAANQFVTGDYVTFGTLTGGLGFLSGLTLPVTLPTDAGFTVTQSGGTTGTATGTGTVSASIGFRLPIGTAASSTSSDATPTAGSCVNLQGMGQNTILQTVAQNLYAVTAYSYNNAAATFTITGSAFPAVGSYVTIPNGSSTLKFSGTAYTLFAGNTGVVTASSAGSFTMTIPVNPPSGTGSGSTTGTVVGTTPSVLDKSGSSNALNQNYGCFVDNLTLDGGAPLGGAPVPTALQAFRGYYGSAWRLSNLNVEHTGYYQGGMVYMGDNIGGGGHWTDWHVINMSIQNATDVYSSANAPNYGLIAYTDGTDGEVDGMFARLLQNGVIRNIGSLNKYHGIHGFSVQDQVYNTNSMIWTENECDSATQACIINGTGANNVVISHNTVSGVGIGTPFITTNCSSCDYFTVTDNVLGNVSGVAYPILFSSAPQHLTVWGNTPALNSNSLGNDSFTAAGIVTPPAQIPSSASPIIVPPGAPTSYATNVVSTSGAYTITAGNSFIAGEYVYLDGFSAATGLNRQITQITSRNSSSYQVTIGSATVATQADGGYAQPVTSPVTAGFATRSQLQTITLTSNATGILTGVVPGSDLTLQICNGATAYTWTPPSGMTNATSAPAANSCNVQSFHSYDGTTLFASATAGGGSGITALTGDVTASGTGSVPATVTGVNGAPIAPTTLSLGSNGASQLVPTSLGANTVMANVTSGTAQPTAVAIPGCATALEYVLGSGFACNTNLNYVIGTGPTTNTTLSAAMTSTQTTVPLTSATGYPVPSSTNPAYLYLGTSNGTGEWVSCTALSGTTYSSCTRGLWNNAAVAQASGASVQEIYAFTTSGMSVSPNEIFIWNGPLILSPTTVFNVTYSYNIRNLTSGTVIGDLNGPLAAGYSLFASSATIAPSGTGGFQFGGGYLGTWNTNGTLTSNANSVTVTGTQTITSTSFVATNLALPALGNTSAPNASAISQSGVVHVRCSIIWQQNTAVSTVQFGVGSSATPQWIYTINKLDPGSYVAPTYVAHAGTASATAFGPYAVSSVSAPSATTTGYQDVLDITMNPGGTYADALTVYALTGNASDAVLILAGSYCQVLP